MTQKFSYPTVECFAIFKRQHGGEVAIHSRNVGAVVPIKGAVQIYTIDSSVYEVTSTFEVVMQRLNGKDAV